MSNYGRLAAESSDRYFTALDAAQENFLKSCATFAASVPVSSMSSQPTMPGLPTAPEVIEATFAFAQKLLNQQQSFMQKLVATTPGEAPATTVVAFGKVVSSKRKNAN